MLFPFPSVDARKDAWKPIVLSTITALGGSEVRFRTVISEIETSEGFPGWETWGMKMKRGKPYPTGHRMVTLAALALKEEGVITSPRRGYYSLVGSEAPVVEAPVAPAVEAPVAPAVEAEVTERLVLATEPTPEPTPEPVGPATHPLYERSERARKAAIRASKCFGFYSERSRSCATCPLAGLCFRARGGKVAEAESRAAEARAAEARATEAALARLKAEHEAEEARVAEEARIADEARVASEVEGVLAGPVETLVGSPAPEAAPICGPDRSTDPGRVTDPIPWDIVCEDCGKPISEGSPSYYIEGVGTFHI